MESQSESTKWELGAGGAQREEWLWAAVLDTGDPEALRELASTVEPIDERELGSGD